MDEPTLLTQRALPHLSVLAEQIGPRPAGSPAEQQARAYVADCMSRWGYRCERQGLLFAALPRVFPTNLLAGAALLCSGWLLVEFPWLAISLPLIFALLPQGTRWLARNRQSNQASENLFCRPGGQETTGIHLVLCAHLDSAPASRLTSRWLRRLESRRMDIVQRTVVLLAAAALLQVLGVALPAWLLVALAGIGSLAGVAWLLLETWGRESSRGAHSPGAHDNASGVSVLLALAEHYAAHPPGKLQIGFLFTTAEETGGHGARAFAATLPRSAPQPQFLVLDMVGAGEVLRWVSKDGLFLPLRSSARLNQIIQQVNPQVRELWYTLRSGDHAAFLEHGLQATALQTSGSLQAELAYHSPDDTLAVIEPPALQMTITTIMQMIAVLASELQE